MAGDPLGLQFAVSGRAGHDRIEQIMARQEELRKQQELEARQREELAGRAEDRSLRSRELLGREADRSTDNARLDRAEAGLTAQRDAATKQKLTEAEAERAVKQNLELILKDPNVSPRMKAEAEYRLKFNEKPPADFFRDHDKERKEKMDDAKELARYRDGIADGNRRAPADKSADDPSEPNGVKNYVMTLGGKYQTFEEAKEELRRAWPNIVSVHQKADPDKILLSLKRQYERPAGTRAPIKLDMGDVSNR